MPAAHPSIFDDSCCSRVQLQSSRPSSRSAFKENCPVKQDGFDSAALHNDRNDSEYRQCAQGRIIRLACQAAKNALNRDLSSPICANESRLPYWLTTCPAAWFASQAACTWLWQAVVA